jgi:hypothetical protein
MTFGDYYEEAGDFVHEALQLGALPSLNFISTNLRHETHRASLTGGLLRGMHELHLIFNARQDEEVLETQLAALGLVRELPALTTLKITVLTDEEQNEPTQWPPFIPPSLKALCMDLSGGWPACDRLLPALPGMLGASGARLDCLEVKLLGDLNGIGGGMIHLAHAQVPGCLFGTQHDP